MNFLTQLMQFINKPFPNEEIWLGFSKYFIPISIFFTLFLFLFQPNDLSERIVESEKASEKYFWETYAHASQIITRELSGKGVKLIAGTDAVIPPTVAGFSLHNELESLNKVGLTNAQVLQAATAVPAEFLKSNAGKIKVGMNANLVLLDKNPLADIRNTRAINTVFSNGKVYDRALLDQLLAAVKAANDECRKVDITWFSLKIKGKK